MVLKTSGLIDRELLRGGKAESSAKQELQLISLSLKKKERIALAILYGAPTPTLLCLPRNLRMEVHKVLRLPRNLRMEVHKVLRLPRNLHMEVHKALRLQRILRMEVH